MNNVIIRYFKDIDHIALNALYATSSFVVSLTTLVFYRQFVNPNGFNYHITGMQFLLLIGNGVLVTIAIQLYIKAFQLDKAGRSSSLWFLAIVVGYAFDIIVYKYQMQTIEIVGSLVIIGASMMMFVLKFKKYSD